MDEWNEQGTEEGITVVDMPADVGADEAAGVAQIHAEADTAATVPGGIETLDLPGGGLLAATDAVGSLVAEESVVGAAADSADDAGSSSASVAEPIEERETVPSVSLRRHRKQPRSHTDTSVNGVALLQPLPPMAAADVMSNDADAVADVAQTETSAGAGLVPVDDLPDPDWRQHWPHNELVIFGRLDPNVSQAPTVDGVSRIRATVEIIEIDEASGASGVVAKVPVQILPLARGFDPVFNEIRRARKQHQRIEPFPVELRGASKRLYDKDARYANTRWSMLFGLEVGLVRRVDRSVEHYGRWRGTGSVSNVRPFEIDTERYLRVTLSVAASKRKAQLRGPSSAIDQVDVLVRVDHAHAQRFRHVGQRLLIEAEVYSQTSVLRATHPDLEGLDDELKERLRILRQGLLLVTMGEFPDVTAEEDFTAWVTAGRPGRPGRPGRRSAQHRHGSTGLAVTGQGSSDSNKPAATPSEAG